MVDMVAHAHGAQESRHRLRSDARGKRHCHLLDQGLVRHGPKEVRFLVHHPGAPFRSAVDSVLESEVPVINAKRREGPLVFRPPNRGDRWPERCCERCSHGRYRLWRIGSEHRDHLDPVAVLEEPEQATNGERRVVEVGRHDGYRRL